MEVEIINPMEIISKMGLPFDHITYNPDVEPQYHIIRGQKHDGLLMFTRDLIRRALLCLLNRTTCYKPEKEKLENIKYEIGNIELSSEYGHYILRKGTESEVGINGVDETLKIPVKCSY